MFSSLSIRIRLILSFTALLCLLLAVAAVSLQRFQSLTEKTGILIDNDVRLVFLVQRANQRAQAAAICLLRLLQTPGRDQRVPIYAEMDADFADFNGAVEALMRGAKMGGGSERVARVLQLSANYGDTFQATVELIEGESLPAAREHFTSKTGVALAELLTATRELVSIQQEVTQADVQHLGEATEQARRVVILLAAIALVTGAGLAWVIARSIVRPVNEAVHVAEAIAAGDYKKEVPQGKGDEIGALLGSLTVMRDSIASREERILHLAYADALTGLPNRTRLIDVFEQLPPGSQGAVAFLDIDRFAVINGVLGHATGDCLLQEVGRRLVSSAGTGATVARLWADQFAILLPGADADAAQLQLQHVLEALRAPMEAQGQRLDVEGTAGIVVFPSGGTDIIALLRRANAARILAKRQQGGIAFCSGEEGEPSREQLSLIGEMRGALSRDEFVVFYQPKMELASDKVTAAEALIRWQHPERGLIPPGRFIPFAEQTGFIREITPWLLRKVVSHACAWRSEGKHIVASVNLSTRDLLGHALIEDAKALVTAAQLPPGLICFEITESALMDEPELALRHLHELADFGFKLSIDDYGSGQASLAYVKSLPVHELKIDREFVTDVDNAPRSAAIVRSTILLCRELGLSIVAEGAETDAEIDWLRTARCDLVQGYGIAKPMPEVDFRNWVMQHNLPA